MPYAIMQKALEAPTVDQLQTAFRGVPGVAAVDARIFAKNIFGVLAQGLTEQQAAAAKAGFTAQNIEVESVDERAVPPMPPIRHVRRLDCTPEALLIYDPIGRPVPLAWNNIMIVAAGQVVMAEFDRQAEDYYVQTRSGPMLRTRYHEDEMHRERWLLEIVIRGGALRFSVNSHEVLGTFFQYLGERQARDFGTNFQMVVRDIIQATPDAALNRGACSIRDQAPKSFLYPNRKAFNEEMIWLLWKLK